MMLIGYYCLTWQRLCKLSYDARPWLQYHETYVVHHSCYAFLALLRVLTLPLSISPPVDLSVCPLIKQIHGPVFAGKFIPVDLVKSNLDVTYVMLPMQGCVVKNQ